VGGCSVHSRTGTPTLFSGWCEAAASLGLPHIVHHTRRPRPRAALVFPPVPLGPPSLGWPSLCSPSPPPSTFSPYSGATGDVGGGYSCAGLARRGAARGHGHRRGGGRGAVRDATVGVAPRGARGRRSYSSASPFRGDARVGCPSRCRGVSDARPSGGDGRRVRSAGGPRLVGPPEPPYFHGWGVSFSLDLPHLSRLGAGEGVEPPTRALPPTSGSPCRGAGGPARPTRAGGLGSPRPGTSVPCPEYGRHRVGGGPTGCRLALVLPGPALLDDGGPACEPLVRPP